MSPPDITSDNPASRKPLAELTLELTPALDALSSAVADLGGTMVAAIEVDGHLIVRRSLRSRFDIMPRDPEHDGAGSSPKFVPATMTPEIREVLGLMVFRTGPLAHLFRTGGADIPKRIEDEQAFILFRFLHLALAHGADWKKRADEDVGAALARTKANLVEESKP